MVVPVAAAAARAAAGQVAKKTAQKTASTAAKKTASSAAKTAGESAAGAAVDKAASPKSKAAPENGKAKPSGTPNGSKLGSKLGSLSGFGGSGKPSKALVVQFLVCTAILFSSLFIPAKFTDSSGREVTRDERTAGQLAMQWGALLGVFFILGLVADSSKGGKTGKAAAGIGWLVTLAYLLKESSVLNWLAAQVRRSPPPPAKPKEGTEGATDALSWYRFGTQRETIAGLFALAQASAGQGGGSDEREPGDIDGPDPGGGPIIVGQWAQPIRRKITTAWHTPGGQWGSGFHTGADFAAPEGTDVFAVGPGTVVKSGVYDPPYGQQIVIKHGDGVYTQYAHLSTRHVGEGATVKAGTLLGGVGSTGTKSSGPHLHFEARTGPEYGSDIDPVAFMKKRGLTLGVRDPESDGGRIFT